MSPVRAAAADTGMDGAAFRGCLAAATCLARPRSYIQKPPAMSAASNNNHSRVYFLPSVALAGVFFHSWGGAATSALLPFGEAVLFHSGPRTAPFFLLSPCSFVFSSCRGVAVF